jgi:hypothetical protein
MKQAYLLTHDFNVLIYHIGTTTAQFILLARINASNIFSILLGQADDPLALPAHHHPPTTMASSSQACFLGKNRKVLHKK